MAASPLSTRPIYLQLRDAMAERIAKGAWKPGQAIPNEGELAREFGVSPGTMRKALSLMESERLITRRQGRGTFINHQASGALVNRYCNIHGTDGERAAGCIEAGEIEGTVANEAECRRLQLRPNDPVWRLRRVRLHQDRAFMYEEIALPAGLFPHLEDSTYGRIVVLAQRHGLLLGAAEERVSIGVACRSAANALNIAQGSPVIVLDRIVHTIDGRPVEWRVAQCDLAASNYLANIS
jgi:GntR family transcriptional regulator